MPVDGYTRMFERILDHPNIEVALRTDLADVRDEVDFGHLVYTGPIDAYFGHRFGALPYRSIVFEHRTVPTPGGGSPSRRRASTSRARTCPTPARPSTAT